MCVGIFVKKGVKLILHARNAGGIGGVYGPALCVYCSSVGVVLVGIVGLGDVGGYPACPVPEFLDLGVER